MLQYKGPYFFVIIVELIIIIILIGQISTGPGTTPNINHIVIGRCYEYISLVNPSNRWVLAYAVPLNWSNDIRICKFVCVSVCMYLCMYACLYRYKCEEIWHEFEKAVIQRTPCSVRVKDYEQMFYAAPQTPPCDKVRPNCVYREFLHLFQQLLMILITWPTVN